MKKIAFIVGTAVVGAALIVTGIASAATVSAQVGGHFGMGMGGPGGMRGMMPGIFGTVSGVNGTTLTVTSKGFAGPYGHPSSTTATPTTYTVNASGATVVKDGASSTISDVSVGDTVVVHGTVTGTNIAATMIADGVVPGGANPGGPLRGGPWMSSSTRPTGSWSGMPAFQGNGEPVVGGTVTAINGSSLTITNKSNVTYTVDGSSATVLKGNVSSTLNAVSINDNVLVQGNVSGTSVTATTILDQGVAMQNGSSTASNSSHGGGPRSFVGGMFGGIGAFFQHLFGFF